MADWVRAQKGYRFNRAAGKNGGPFKEAPRILGSLELEYVAGPNIPYDSLHSSASSTCNFRHGGESTCGFLLNFTNLDVFPADGKRFDFFANTMDLETQAALRKVCACVFTIGNLQHAVDPDLDTFTLRENSIVVPAVFLVDLIGDFRFRSQQPATDTFEPDSRGIAVCSDLHLRSKKRFPVSSLFCLHGIYFRQASRDFIGIGNGTDLHARVESRIALNVKRQLKIAILFRRTQKCIRCVGFGGPNNAAALNPIGCFAAFLFPAFDVFTVKERGPLIGTGIRSKINLQQQATTITR